MSEFTWLNKQGVASTLGFEVQMVDRGCIEYREDGRIMSIEVEMGMNGGTYCLLYSPGCFKRWDESEAISIDEQTRIEQNFRRAFEFQNVPVVAETPE
jgi:hypothetical protein